jgi:hypothetical protein
MAEFRLAPTVVRARRTAALMLSVLLVAAAGCGEHHRRTSMRPIFVRPSAGCPTGNCGGVVAPAAPVAAPTTEPALVEPGSAAGASVGGPAPLSNAPAPLGAPRAASPAAPGSGPSLQGPVPEEPSLEPAPAEERRPSAAPAPKDQGTGTTAPGTSLKSSSGRRTASGRVRQASLSERLAPFVNDPADLFSPPKADRPWKYVVLHHSATDSGGYDSIDRAHRDRLGWQGCGYHFVIGNGTESPDGRIEVARRWTEQRNGVHCRDGKEPDVNEYGIGICLVGDLEKSPPTPRQVAAAQALVAYLRDRYQIPADHTATHAHLAAAPTSCPGRMFPAQAILASPEATVR